VTIIAATKIKAAPKTSMISGILLLMRTCATNATMICDVLKVEAVDGGIMISALKRVMNPRIPAK
jgi:hypothetical protein